MNSVIKNDENIFQNTSHQVVSLKKIILIINLFKMSTININLRKTENFSFSKELIIKTFNYDQS